MTKTVKRMSNEHTMATMGANLLDQNKELKDQIQQLKGQVLDANRNVNKYRRQLVDSRSEIDSLRKSQLNFNDRLINKLSK